MISDSKSLQSKRDKLDPFRKIKIRGTFGSVTVPPNSDRIGFCTFLDRIIVTDDDNNIIKVFDLKGEFITQVTYGCNRFDGPCGVCTFGDKLLVCGDYRISILDRNLKHVRDISFERFNPTVICVTKEGLLVTVTAGRSTLILGLDGNIKEQYYKSRTEGICCNGKNQILVANGISHSIEILGKHGEYLPGFGSKGGDSNQLCEPRGICIDQGDNIYIADKGNNRISIFTPEGIPIQQVGIHMPIGLLIIERTILVATYNGSVYSLYN